MSEKVIIPWTKELRDLVGEYSSGRIATPEFTQRLDYTILNMLHGGGGAEIKAAILSSLRQIPTSLVLKFIEHEKTFLLDACSEDELKRMDDLWSEISADNEAMEDYNANGGGYFFHKALESLKIVTEWKGYDVCPIKTNQERLTFLKNESSYPLSMAVDLGAVGYLYCDDGSYFVRDTPTFSIFEGRQVFRAVGVLFKKKGGNK